MPINMGKIKIKFSGQTSPSYQWKGNSSEQSKGRYHSVKKKHRLISVEFTISSQNILIRKNQTLETARKRKA